MPGIRDWVPSSLLPRSTAGSKRPPAPLGGKGLGIHRNAKRHRKILRDTVQGVTKGDIRRLARRGGVKRISRLIYGDVRMALKARLQAILRDCVAIVESRGQRTITTRDVVFALQRLGNPIYGFGEIER